MKSDTQALVMAGRAIEVGVLTNRALAAIRAACDDLDVVVAGDPRERGLDETICARVVIGEVAVRAQSEYRRGVTADPLPVDRAAIDAAVARVRAIDAARWAAIAALVPPQAPLFSAARRRPSLPAHIRADYASVAFDGPELPTLADRVFLVATGPLAGAVLARGEVRPLPVDEDGHILDELLDDDDSDWIWHGGNNEQPANAVFGETVRRIHIEGHGAIALEPAELDGPLVLLAVYD